MQSKTMKKCKKLFSFALALVVAASIIPADLAKAADTDPIGIDVSWEEGTIDWEQASAEVDFAVIRATEGTTVDDEFANNADGCTANGVPFGVSVYTLAQTADDAIAEAETVVAMLEGYTVDLPIYMEFEDADMFALSDAEILAVVTAFVDTITAAGYEAGLYATIDTYNYYFAEDTYYAGLNIWVSDLDSTSLPLASANMWQYTWEGAVAGVDADASLNYFYGDLPVEEHTHTVGTDAARAPTCTETGLTEGSHCSDCGEVLVAQEVVPVLGHTASPAVTENVVAKTSIDRVVYCSVCGAEMSRETIPMLRVSSATIKCEDDISIVYKAKATCIDGVYDDVYVVVTQELENGETKQETIIGELSADGTVYEYKYAGLNAKQAGDAMSITIYGYRNGEFIEGETLNYSLMTYCLNQLSKTASGLKMSAAKASAFKTVIVDLIVYAATAQEYFEYKTSSLVTEQLTAEQLTMASPDSALDGIAQITNITYETVDNPTATWNSAGLNLLAKTTVRLKFTYAGDVSNLKLIANVGGHTDFEVTEFEALGNNQYYVYFDQIRASQWSSELTFKLVEGDTVVSNTILYSVESYVAKYQTNATMGATLVAMAKYGRAASVYNATP